MDRRPQNDTGRDESRNPKPPRILIEALRDRMRLQAVGYLANSEYAASARKMLEAIAQREHREAAQ